MQHDRRPDPTWKVHRMEEEFPRLIFDVRGVQSRKANEEEIMIAEVMATVENGTLKLDGAKPFPD